MVDGLTTTNVFYFFWLPAGKDEFGFDKSQDAPLAGTAHYRQGLERTIADNIARRTEALRGSDDDLARLTRTGNVGATDAVLGLRKIAFQFTYRPAPRTLGYHHEDIKGHAIFLSNGLYLWQFAFPHPPDLNGQDLWDRAEKFLKEDFVEVHLRRLLHLGWPNEEAANLSTYRGILTYYQLDLLFNGLFDSAAHPHGFLGQSSATSENDFDPASPPMYNLERVVTSCSVMALGTTYKPIYDERKNFSLRGASQCDLEAYVSTTAELYEASTPNGVEAVTTIAAERLLSRLSFAAMEQFVRVGVSFGLLHYKIGLDHCRAELTGDALQIRVSRDSGERLRPSLSTISSPTLAEVEAYSSLLSGKVPAFLLVHSLIEDLAEVSSPLDARNSQSFSGKGAAEWTYSKATLSEALLQYERQLNTLRSSLAVIDRNLQYARIDQVITELTETRKLAEIESESPRQIFLKRSGSEADNEIIKRLTLVALIFAGLQVYAGIGVWLMERLNDPTGFIPPGIPAWRVGVMAGQWVLVVLAVIGLYLFLRSRPVYRTAVKDSDLSDRYESHVYDYSFLRERIDGGTAASKLDQLAQAMIDIETGKRRPCFSRSSFRETPSGGVERTKDTLESLPNPSKNKGKRRSSYMLHVEIDRRTSGLVEYLTDIRLVIKVPVGQERRFSVDHRAREIITDCVERLVLAAKPERERQEFFADQFGWHASSS